MRGAVIGRLLASRNPWVMAAAGLVLGYRWLQKRAAQGENIGPFARLPGLRPQLASASRSGAAYASR